MAARPLQLDIACGRKKRQGFTGIDIAPLPGVDIVHDLEVFPWPIEDGCVELANVSHYIEHTKDLIQFMNELYRIMRPGGICVVTAPYYNSIRAWQDPTHTRAISEATFSYFNAAWRKSRELEHYPITCDFDADFRYVYMPNWESRSEPEKQFARQHFTNVVADLQARLVKK